jgi:hypothetical protein
MPSAQNCLGASENLREIRTFGEPVAVSQRVPKLIPLGIQRPTKDRPRAAIFCCRDWNPPQHMFLGSLVKGRQLCTVVGDEDGEQARGLLLQKSCIRENRMYDNVV